MVGWCSKSMEMDFKSSLSVGHISKNDVSGLWTSSIYENLRKNIKKN